jgi:hypothetical protein
MRGDGQHSFPRFSRGERYCPSWCPQYRDASFRNRVHLVSDGRKLRGMGLKVITEVHVHHHAGFRNLDAAGERIALVGKVTVILFVKEVVNAGDQ